MITFVILHYNSIEDTKKCIESILNSTKVEMVEIVVVDNKSPNHSGDELKKKYATYGNITVILNDENLGYAKGNNVGCTYAIEQYNPEFLFVINNDIIINDKYILEKIYAAYNKKAFDILGPQIWNIKRKYNQNPFKVSNSIDAINIEQKRHTIKMRILQSKVPCFYWLYERFINDAMEKVETIHGAAIIFSKNYYSKFEEIFPEIGFMYGEENHLEYRRCRYNLEVVFDYSISVNHNHSSATRSSFKSSVEKWKFYESLHGENLIKLKKIIEENLDI